MHLKVKYDNTLDVFEGDLRIAQIADSAYGWALYEATSEGRGIFEDRHSTHSTIQRAVDAAKQFIK